MKQKQAYVFSLRLPDEHMKKLRVIADDNARSVNKEIELLVRNRIEEYEAQKGAIQIEVGEE